MSITSEQALQSRLKDALVALQKMRTKLENIERAATEPLAVVGMGCRFPGGVNDPASYWQLLQNGVDAIGEVPPDRWDIDAYYDPDPEAPGKMSSRWGGFLDHVDQFDAQLFGISPREARSMDPQQRLLLEVSWAALENAGLAPLELAGSQTGVFVGITVNDYLQLQANSAPVSEIDAYRITGNCLNAAAGRLAYTYGFNGPALAVDTACSSSLVAVHLACQSLRNHESNLALACGVNLILSPDMTISATKANMMASDGRCKTFDARADGFVRSEGCGVVVLKRLADAQAAGDTVYAIIRGTAVNQDGASSGLTVPSKDAQEAVIRMALANGRVEPAQVSYVEAHGTGTSLGDPIEVRALAAVLAEGRQSSDPFYLGSVKTNLGHLESAAGVAALIKVVLSLYHQELPPHLHFDSPTPNIDWKQVPAVVPTVCTTWTGAERVAGVSAFGVTGTNAHAILAAAPAARTAVEAVGAAARAYQLLTLSAHQDETLKELAASYDSYLGKHPDMSLGDLCYSSATGRSHLDQRLAVVAESTQQMRERLAAASNGERPVGVLRGQLARGTRAKVAFLFTGHGAQYPGMGQVLYATEAVFRKALQECDQLLRPYLEQPLLEVMYPSEANAARWSHLWQGMTYTQPMLFALEYALAQLWQSWGVTPDVVVGHSVGEYVAACVAGAINLEDGLKLVATRGRLMDELPGSGLMAAVFADPSRVAAAVETYAKEVSVAVINGPSNVVISGASALVQQLMAAFQNEGIKSRQLAIGQASHSPMVEPILDEFERIAKEATFKAPQIPLIANVSGRFFERGEVPDAAYWRRHLRSTVQFAASMELLHAKGYQLFLEVGPSPTLLGMGRHCLPEEAEATWLPSLRKDRHDQQQMLESLGTLYTQGVAIEWRNVYQEQVVNRVTLPVYAFDRKRYWLQPKRGSRNGYAPAPQAHPLLGQRVRTAGEEILFEAHFSLDVQPFLEDHRVLGQVVAPATAYFEMAYAAANQAFAVSKCSLTDVMIHQPLVLAHAETVQIVQCVLTRATNQEAKFKVFSKPAEGIEETTQEWRLHASGTILLNQVPALTRELPQLAELRDRCRTPVSLDLHYQRMAERGLEYGPRFQAVTQMWTSAAGNEVLGQIVLPKLLESEADHFHIHPALLDGCMQLLGANLTESEGSDNTYLPISADRFVLYHQPGAVVWSHVTRRVGTPTQAHAEMHPNAIAEAIERDVRLYDEQGQLIGELSGLTLKRTDALQLGITDGEIEKWLYEVVWRSKPLEPVEQTTPLLPPQAVAASVQPFIVELAQEERLQRALEMIPHLEALSTTYMVQAMQQLGWQPKAGEPVDVASLAEQVGVAPQHMRLLGRMLEIFEEEGWLARQGEGWQVRQRFPRVDAEALRQQLMADYPAGQAEWSLLRRVGEQYGAALQGEVEVLELLFLGDALAETTALYQDSPFSYGANRLVQAVVNAATAGVKEQGRKLRVLEIGGGTGGMTAHLLPKLEGIVSAYTFTDISSLFTIRAREQFGNYDFFEVQTLDIERAPEEQGFDPHSYDLVVAANVLHATQTLSQTLAHVRRLLAPGGQLLLLEGRGRQRFADLIVGLTEGWWRFVDGERRDDYALLHAEGWQAVLAEEGFADTVVFGDSTTMPHQMVILSQLPAQNEVSEQNELAQKASRWLVLADDGGVGEALAQRLRGRSDLVQLVYRGAAFQELGRDHFQVNPAYPGDFHKLIAAIHSGEHHSLRTIHLWALDRPLSYPELLSAAELAAYQRDLCGSVLHLLQALATVEEVEDAGLWLVTRGAQPAGSAEELSLPGVAQSSLWGLGKVISQEHPDLNCRCIDLDPVGGVDEVDLLEQLLAGRYGDQVALRGNYYFVPRLVASSSIVRTHEKPQIGNGQIADNHIMEGQPYQLVLPADNTFQSLQFQPLERRKPSRGEVEIEVIATGLGFRDVLRALGMVAQDTRAIGAECAGQIVAVGEGVEGFEIGDAVIAVAFGSFDSHVTVAAECVEHKPAQLSMVETATIPSAFLTAHYTLHHLAKIRAGDRVLIHAAAGGVGLAAVQVAQKAGAVVFGTAGGQAKRTVLKSLGVGHVMDSRSLDFADEVLALTNGEGVDIVLNSLAGDFIAKSLSVLKEDGTFLEIGKRDVWDEKKVKALKPDASYTVADLVKVGDHEPALMAMLLREVVAAFDNGTYHPLPVRVFPIDQLADAFRYMAQAKHVGKIVIDHKPQGPPAHPSTTHGDATYLVTGGLTGLGLEMARWLVNQGARDLVLVGRSVPSAESQIQLDELEKAGTRITVAQADVSKVDEIRQVFLNIEEAHPPLRGILHSAGVLDDGVLLQQDWSAFAKVFAPKVEGSWNLHNLTRNKSLDFFILFSSAVSMLGSAGQSNHVAASTFLDALAHYRHSQGLPALSIDWGPWSEIGAAASARVERHLKQRGIGVIEPTQGVRAFEHILQKVVGQPCTPALPQVGVIRADWSRFDFQSAGQRVPPFFSEVIREKPKRLHGQVREKESSRHTITFRQRLAQTAPDKHVDLLVGYVREQALQVLGLEQEYPLEARRPFQELGMDSLMAVELRNRLSAGLELQQKLPSILIFDYPTIEALTTYLTTKVLSAVPEFVGSKSPVEATNGTEDDQKRDDQKRGEQKRIVELENLSDEDAETLLLAKLEMFGRAK